MQNRVHPVFSQDNRYLAVATPRGLVVLDAATGHGRKLSGPGEVVTSLVWLGPDQLGYAACADSGGKTGLQGTLRFWRQRPDETPADREMMFSFEEAYGCPGRGLGGMDWPRERWSPDGRFVLLPASAPSRELKLLDLKEHTSRILATGVLLEGISWKTDGSEAACVGFRGERPMVAFLLDPRTGAMHDFSAEFNEVFGETSNSPAPWISPLWAPGDRFLLVNHATKGGYLVRPRPWEAIPVGKLLVDHLAAEGTRVLAQDPSTWLPWVFRQPIEGWVRVWVQFDEGGYRRGIDFLVDDSGGSVRVLGESSAPGGGWKLTPDGTLAVKLEGPCELTVRNPNLPGIEPGHQAGK